MPEDNSWVLLGYLEDGTNITFADSMWTWTWNTSCTTGTTRYTLRYKDWGTTNGRTMGGWRRMLATNWSAVRSDEVDPLRIDAQREIAQQERQRRAQARTTATARAEALLHDLLDEGQRASLQAHGYFDLIGSHGGYYRISTGISGNVAWRSPEGQWSRICAHPDMRLSWMPTEDVMVAQMLALVTDEPAFIARANVHAGVRPVVAAA